MSCIHSAFFSWPISVAHGICVCCIGNKKLHSFWIMISLFRLYLCLYEAKSQPHQAKNYPTIFKQILEIKILN